MPEQWIPPGSPSFLDFDDDELSIEVIKSALSGHSLAVMLYGSRARRTARPDSDVDVLQLVSDNPRSYSSGRVNVTAYTPEHLTLLGIRGSLFVRHLKDEGIVIDDRDGVLGGVLSAYREPLDYASLKRDLAIIFAAINTVGAADYERGILRLITYSFRTAVYVRSAESGRLCFDMDEACREYGDSDLLVLLREHRPVPAKELALAGLELLQLEIPEDMPDDFSSIAIWARDSAPMAATLLEAVIAGKSEISYTSLTLAAW
jgi:predicted nucleotidyltransferase